MIRVFSVVIPSRILTLFISEGFLVFACYLFAAWIDPDVGDLTSFLTVDSGALRILVVDLAILMGLYFRDLYTELHIRNRIALLQELAVIFGVAFVVQGIINYLNHDLTIPRKVMILGSLLAFTCIFCWRLLFAAAAKDVAATRCLVFLGMSPTIASVARYLWLHPELGLSPAGYLDDTADASAPLSLPHLGTLANLDDAIEATQPASIIIGKRETVQPWLTDDFLELHFGGIQTEEASVLYEKAFGRVCASEVWPRDLVFGDAFEPRSLDLNIQTFYSAVLAFFATIILLPAMAAVALFLKLSSQAPILLRERRVGLHGAPFVMYSFRSPSEFLRRSGLRALPRLFNVLAGQMSLVGPYAARPEFAARLAKEIPFYEQRHRVKPGLTGWEQIHRDILHPPDSVCRLEYDLYYLKNLSPSLDSVVLLLSLKKLLVGEPASI